MRQAALLQQQARGQGLVYRLRAGPTGSGPVLAAWPAEIGVAAAIAAAEEYGREHGLAVVIRRAWLETRIGRWVIAARVLTPDGLGEVVDYDPEADQQLVLLDGETEARRYAADALQQALEW
jgi:hypothetical protein